MRVGLWRKASTWGLLLVAVSGLVGSGCRAVHPRTDVGTGTYSYVNRSLVWTYSYALADVWAASLAALAELNYGIEAQVYDGLGGRLEALAAVGGRLSLEAAPEGNHSTRLRVWGSGFGNRHESEQVHKVIQAKLGVGR